MFIKYIWKNSLKIKFPFYQDFLRIDLFKAKSLGVASHELLKRNQVESYSVSSDKEK